jgi:predicted amidohydrolase
MACRWGEIEANLAAIEAYARIAKGRGAAMVVFPELTVSGIFKDEQVWALAEALDGPSVRQVCQMAREAGLVIGFGFTEKALPLPYNAYCLATPEGRLAGVYRKNYIPQLEVPFWQAHHERPVFTAIGKRLAVAICFDNCQPDLLAHYGGQRAEVVLMPHAWDADPLDLQGRDLKHNSMAELIEHQRAGRLGGWKSHDAMRDYFYGYIPLRARENGFYALFVNQAGRPHEALCFSGPTFAVDPHGEILVETRDGAEQMLLVEIR